MAFLAIGRRSAILADVKFCPPLLVGVTLLHPVDFFQVGLQGTALGESFVTELTFVRTHTCGMGERRRRKERSRMSSDNRDCPRTMAALTTPSQLTYGFLSLKVILNLELELEFLLLSKAVGGARFYVPNMFFFQLVS